MRVPSSLKAMLLATTLLSVGVGGGGNLVIGTAYAQTGQDGLNQYNQAAQLKNQGKYKEAEPHVRQALAFFERVRGPVHSDVAQCLNLLGQVLQGQGRYAEAEPLYKRSLAIDEKVLGPEHATVATMLSNLGTLYQDQGRYAEAEPLFKRALAIGEKVLGPEHPDVAIRLNNLGSLYQDQGRYADALPIVLRTIKQRAEVPWISLAVLKGAEPANLLNAAQSFDYSYDVLQSTSGSAAGTAVQKLALRYASGSDDLAKLVRHDQDLAVEADKLDKNLTAEVSKPTAQHNQVLEDQMRKRLADIAAEKTTLNATLVQRFPNYVSLTKPAPLSLAETQALLGDDEAVVAIKNVGQKSYAWVVTKDKGAWVEINITDKTLNDQVQQLRQSLTFETDKPFDTALAYKLYQELFSPIADQIAGKKHLSIVTNGALTSIPLELLVTSDPTGKGLKDVDWLVKSHSVTVIPSIFSLKTMRALAGTSSAPKPMIAFADPVFSQQARQQAAAQHLASRSLTSFYQGAQLDVHSLGEALLQLPATRTEVQAIGKTLNVAANDLKFGLDASVTAVKQSPLDQYRIVYFATHALVAGDLEKFSKAKAEPALILSIPDKPTDQDNGILPASDVAQLKLNADWVVLSACNTASSEGVGAEALSGLARAFLYAGARSLVVSNWDVSDDATASLMSTLFNISSKNPNLSHGEALQQAELKLLNEAKTDAETHPRYWAPFEVVGEPAVRKM